MVARKEEEVKNEEEAEVEVKDEEWRVEIDDVGGDKRQEIEEEHLIMLPPLLLLLLGAVPVHAGVNAHDAERLCAPNTIVIGLKGMTLPLEGGDLVTLIILSRNSIKDNPEAVVAGELLAEFAK